MTNKRAIIILKNELVCKQEECNEITEALNMAIDALEQEAEIEEKTEWFKEALNKGLFKKEKKEEL